MPKFRKRPVEIEARLFSGGYDNAQELVLWAAEYGETITWVPQSAPARTRQEAMFEHKEGLIIHTLEGQMAGPVGWWIIRGVENEFYACEPKIFDKTYERVQVVMLLCECCGYPKRDLPYCSRDDISYCQACWDAGCDLRECEIR
jgi:hypothetical protein